VVQFQLYHVRTVLGAAVLGQSVFWWMVAWVALAQTATSVVKEVVALSVLVSLTLNLFPPFSASLL
jgi:hypothetical protein